MGILSNARHEKFAQELAKGTSCTAAYVAAGYKKSRAHAARLATKGNVRARVAELLNAGAQLSGVTIEGQTTRLERIANAASGLSVARAAQMDISKLNGLVVEKKEIRSGALDDLPPATLTAVRDQLTAERDRRNVRAKMH
jgi:hypothetical protein